MTINSWDGFGDYLVQTRYAVRDPKTGEAIERTYDDVVSRIQKGLNELDVHDVYKAQISNINKAIEERILITASPFLMAFANPHTKRKGYFSCFPLGKVEDSMQGIGRMCKLMEQIYMRGGGAGVDISNLRSKGSPVDGGQGIAGGPVGFLPKFDSVTGTTNQGGRRRGALLIQMDWNHPDVVAFIKAKAIAPKMAKFIKSLPDDERPAQNPILSNMNLSINIDNEFFNDPQMVRLVAENMWGSGDPGLLYTDNMVKFSPFNEEDDPRYSNPCVAGSTILRSPVGDTTIKELVDSGVDEIPVYCCNPETGKLAIRTGRNPRCTGKNKKVYKVIYSRGKSGHGEIIVTGNHKFLKFEGGDITTDELSKGTRIRGFSASNCNHIIMSVEEYGYEDVYNITVDEYHTVAWNDVITANCGEFLAPKGLSCNLLTINVARIARICYDRNSNDFLSEFYKQVAYYASLACYLGNMIIDMNEGYPSDSIQETTQKFRPVGVGMSGFHTALILAYYGKVAYGSSEAVDFAGKTQAALTTGTLFASSNLLNTFADNLEDIYKSNYWEKHVADLRVEMVQWLEDYIAVIDDVFNTYEGFYNCITTSQAPTGSVSQFLKNLDTGIEPYYSLRVTRKVRDFDDNWVVFDLIPNELQDLLEADSEFKEKVEAQTALNLTMEQQLDMLFAFQKYIHTGVSKTVNCSNETTIEQIEELIFNCRDKGFKGLTVYREGCREDDTVLTMTSEQKTKKPVTPLGELDHERDGKTFEIRGPITSYLTVNYDEDGKIRECFIRSGDTGTGINALHATIGRVISTGLRFYPDLLDPLIHTMSKVQAGEFYSCHTRDGDIRSYSLPHMISQLLEYATKTEKPKVESKSESLDFCPECQGLTLGRKGNCRECKSCGYSTC